MKYQTDDCSEYEIIWNSRDGVTPFTIALRSGKFATHVDWNQDRCVPDYIPQVGERIFVDLTPERAEEIARNNLETWSSNPDFKDYGPLPTLEELLKAYMRPGAPDLIEVTSETKLNNTNH